MTTGCDWPAGLDLVAHYARQGAPFSSNDCRDSLRDLGFDRWTTGRLFQLAEKNGVIRQCGLTRSNDRRTRSRLVQWITTSTRPHREQTVIVHRDDTGRFAHAAADYQQEGLF